MPDEKAPPKRKQGIYGWRAFFLMFGCGGAAALLVIGTVAGVIRMTASSLTSEDSGDSVALPTREPVATMTPGAIDLCELINDAPPVTLTARIDEPNGPDETGAGGGQAWTVSDECSWGLIGEDSREWEMRFSYKAIIATDGNEKRFSMAKDRFEKESDSARRLFGVIEVNENSSNEHGRQREIFGVLDSGAQAYVLVREVKSSVYVVDIREQSESPGNEDYRIQQFGSRASDISTLVDNPLRDVVPD
ncbi:hypothetical protein ACFQZ2_09265 [Streptomonospora algeriensis]|uniref:DUF3558 domain-containing protein n=1 Tax=Streptomonospora algeriensis TaxID=995084 RepID=A0ABW3BGR7_9ACTN